VAITLAFIVLMDANSLRQQVGKHAKAINVLNQPNPTEKPLRERMGHTRIEILAGIVVGAIVAYALYTLLVGQV